jgi:hypothetical protein
MNEDTTPVWMADAYKELKTNLEDILVSIFLKTGKILVLIITWLTCKDLDGGNFKSCTCSACLGLINRILPE